MSVLPPLQECSRGCGGGQAPGKGARPRRVHSLGRKLKQQEVPGTWAPFSTFGWSLSPSHKATSSQPGCCSLPPKPALPASPLPPGGGVFQGPCDSPGSWQSVELQRLLCWAALSCQELQGFSTVASCVSSQQLWGRLCNDWVLKIEKTKVCIYFHQIKTAKKREGSWGRKRSCGRRTWITSRD